MKSLFLLLVAVAVMAMPGTLKADNHGAKVAEIADELAFFESKSIEVRREAARLESFNRSRVGWQTHSEKLSTMRDHVNDLGKQLTKLEEMAPHGSEMQQKAIAYARPHLKELADELEQAIAKLNQDRSYIRSEEYKEMTRQMYRHSNALYTTVDTIIDYKDARLRMKQLNLPPAGGQ